jgi:hypothetical protein
VCQQLLDVAFAQAGTALTGWLHSKWQEWRAGNGPLPGSDKGQRTRRRENLWVRTTNYELRGLAQRLRREGWVYLRGTLHVFNTSPTDWKDTMPIVVVPPDCYPPAELTLFALASGGAKPPAPCRVTISVEGYLRAVKDQPDRTHLRLDGLSWQHV